MSQVTGAKAKAKTSKAARASECHCLEQLPNIGPAAAADLRLMGITEPQQLRGQDAFGLLTAQLLRFGDAHQSQISGGGRADVGQLF